MKGNFQKRWVLVAVVWGVAGLLTLWNTLTINRLAPLQAAFEQTRMDAEYCRRHAGRMAEVVEKKGRYYHVVASPNLGVLSVQETLRRLAQSSGLKLLKSEPATGQASPEDMPFALRFAGHLEDGTAFLRLLEQHCPYLPLASATIAAAPGSGTAEFDITLRYRYRVGEPEAAPDPPADAV